ncbi:Duf1677 family protein [Thalictrum thalictroides]|uniref:Duf1677 family protein n=1 Tax=Thalictrum thalictroides TaxID=46969 RepID=A0A7J6VGK4_THATH|nr:Duf1677 family protein [Thalictrum thalictroides]
MDSRSDHEGLRRAVSDVYIEIDKLQKDQDTGAKTMNEVEKAECRCCGLNEDCTPDYIKHVRDSHCGHWVCGLCSEAVKERLSRVVPISTMEEALCAHAEICQKFNNTTRLNPKLSLAWAMRDIAKKKSQQRVPDDSKTPSTSKIARTSSCFAKIDLE